MARRLLLVGIVAGLGLGAAGCTAPELEVSVDAVARITPSGEVSISGIVSCNRPNFVFFDRGVLTQPSTGAQGTIDSGVRCTGETRFTEVVRPATTAPLVEGRAELDLVAHIDEGCGDLPCMAVVSIRDQVLRIRP